MHAFPLFHLVFIILHDYMSSLVIQSRIHCLKKKLFLVWFL